MRTQVSCWRRSPPQWGAFRCSPNAFPDLIDSPAEGPLAGLALTRLQPTPLQAEGQRDPGFSARDAARCVL
eukprot:2992226-Pyramimonas_sp.AAC.1